MRNINFIVGGMLGDFIQLLFAIKNICLYNDSKANIYLTDKHGSDQFSFGIDQSYKDLYPVVCLQTYVNKFEIMSPDFNDLFINMNNWRTPSNGFIKCWSEMLFDCYNFYILNDEYKWINIDRINKDIVGKVLIHKSLKRHNADFNLMHLINNIQDEMLFITSSTEEWDNFPYKDKCKLYFVSTIEEMTIAINSCKYFIGNQSAPFAIASALDVNRFIELDKWGGGIFYIGEEKYSNKISWFLNSTKNHFTPETLLFYNK